MSDAKRIADSLMIGFRQSFFLPGYTPSGWWECDVFEVTKAGYFREYEIKTSRGDFFRDAAKAMPAPYPLRAAAFASGSPEPTGPRKHDRLAAGDPRGPSRFWYVVPAGLLMLDEVPEWAGLIECDLTGKRVTQTVARAAPKLHGEPIDPEVAKHARGVCYYRFHELRGRKR